MSFLSDLFSPKKQTLTPDKEQSQMDSLNSLGAWGQKYLANYEPGKKYTGDFTAGMSDAEKQGMGYLQQFLTQPDTSQGYDLAMNEINKTMTGGYDPATSDYYKSMRTAAGVNTQDAIDASKRNAGYRGSLLSGSQMRNEDRLRSDQTNYLNSLLGSMSEKERQNRLSAVPQAMQLEQYKQGVPLAKATAATSIGSLPRLIEQADLEARYNAFLNQQKELSGVPGTLQGVASTSINYGTKQLETASPFERIMSTVAPVLGSWMGNPFGSFGLGGQSGSSSGTGGTQAGNNAYTNFVNPW